MAFEQQEILESRQALSAILKGGNSHYGWVAGADTPIVHVTFVEDDPIGLFVMEQFYRALKHLRIPRVSSDQTILRRQGFALFGDHADIGLAEFHIAKESLEKIKDALKAHERGI